MLYGMLATVCGYTWEYIDESMDIPRFAALAKYWKEVPPVGVTLTMIAAGLGVKSIGTRRKQSPKEEADALATGKAFAKSMKGGAIG